MWMRQIEPQVIRVDRLYHQPSEKDGVRTRKWPTVPSAKRKGRSTHHPIEGDTAAGRDIDVGDGCAISLVENSLRRTTEREQNQHRVERATALVDVGEDARGEACEVRCGKVPRNAPTSAIAVIVREPAKTQERPIERTEMQMVTGASAEHR